MNNLLLFFALPVATILLSIVLQKILNCTIIAYITATITRFIMRIIECQNNHNSDNEICDDINVNSDTSNICNCLMENNTNGCRYSRKYWH